MLCCAVEGELPPRTRASVSSLAATGMTTFAVGSWLIRTENVAVVTPVSLTVTVEPGAGETTNAVVSLSMFGTGTVCAPTEVA